MLIAPRIIQLSAAFSGLGLAALWWALATADSSLGSNHAAPTISGLQAVDDDMHHFMEYVFEPNYQRLSAGLAQKPKDRKAWKSIRGDALTLAECANLLLIRGSEDDRDAWRQLSLSVRTRGSELYQAARKADYASARMAYGAMLEKCNACHQKFAAGEHQLKP